MGQAARYAIRLEPFPGKFSFPQLQLGVYSVGFFFPLLVMLPSEIPKLPTEPPVRQFPTVWKLLLLHVPSPEPNILECKVKWVLGSITTNKASEGDGIPVELFQILKDDAVKVLHSICQQTWKTQQWPQDWKRSVFISIP